MIRNETLNKRKGISEREEKDRTVRELFFEYLPETVERVFVFCSFGSEVDTHKIIDRLLEEKKEVYLPVVTGRTEMHFFRIFSRKELKVSAFGVPEPDVFRAVTGAQETGELRKEQIIREQECFPKNADTDLVVVPGSVFDENGGRMGYGGGFYDRYLSVHPARTLALAYELQVVKEPLPLEAHDIPMDKLITETGIRVFKE